MRITYLSTQTSADYVRILHSNGSQLTYYDGTPGPYSATYTIWDSAFLQIRFTSDGGTVYYGFHMNITLGLFKFLLN